MPELPEVETVRRGLAPVLEGAVIGEAVLRRSGLRFPFPPHLAENLRGQRIAAVRRRAKYLLIELENGQTLISHLGMSGSWRIEAAAAKTADMPAFAPLKHDHLMLAVERSAPLAAAGARPAGALPAAEAQKFYVSYNDPRRFGFLLAAATESLPQHPLLEKLGIEPLGNALSGPFLQQAFAGKRAPLKSILLSQNYIAGLGNIYVCEALWRAQLLPMRAAATLADKGAKAAAQAENLAQAIRSVLLDALASGGSHLRNYVKTDGSLGYFQHQFQVYGRENAACRRCGAQIMRQSIGGRSSFYCEQCQK